MNNITPEMQRIFNDVAAERFAQDSDIDWLHDDGKWALILLKQLGEASNYALRDRRQQCRKELIQASAVILAQIEQIDSRYV